jgi:hypothetical protein
VNYKQQELEEILTSLIDGEYIAPDLREELLKRLDTSTELRVAHSIQTATKNILINRKDALSIHAPLDVQMAIQRNLANEKSMNSAEHSSKFERTFNNVYNAILNIFLKPVIAFPLGIIIGISGYLLYNQSSIDSEIFSYKNITHNGNDNLCFQAYNNFHSLEQGNLPLQMLTNNKDELSIFFKEKGVSYPVFYPDIDAELQGGVVSDYKGVKLAHFVFKVGDKFVYMYEVPNQMIDNHNLQINPKAIEIVNKADWYWEKEKGSNNTMVLWRIKSNMCSIVTNLRMDQLSALIHVKES